MHVKGACHTSLDLAASMDGHTRYGSPSFVKSFFLAMNRWLALFFTSLYTLWRYFNGDFANNVAFSAHVEGLFHLADVEAPVYVHGDVELFHEVLKSVQFLEVREICVAIDEEAL
mmetsp:Transcript_22008/g.30827  ORF Transcript_22008/g.30827 Transcript_22008/m.30827 type:complete len:115 (+) Transcript_22008:205-549(+)